MSFWKTPAKAPAPQAPAVAGMTAQPLVIRQGADPDSEQAKVTHAKYRLDAIKRTIEQSAQFPQSILDEFRAEIRECTHTLVKAGVITDEHAAALIRDGNGATL